MKTKSFIFFFTVLLVTACQTPPSKQTLLTQLFAIYEQEMEQEFGIHLLRHRMVAEPNLRKISVDFYGYEETEVLQARVLVHQATRQLLQKINGSSALRPLLHHYPLTESDIEVSISFIDPTTHKQYPFDQLAHASLINGYIYYSRHKNEGIKAFLTERYLPQQMIAK